jgi:DNA gyrase subunit A
MSEQLDLFGRAEPTTKTIGKTIGEAVAEAIDQDSTMGGKKRAVPGKIATRSRGGSPPAPPRSGSSGAGSGGMDLDASLMAETRRRYLNYAMSVITARALPDVRDGLKPVQRRILFAMVNDERLYPDAKHRKSAKVVGSVIGKYHPHGDTAVYDAMVRMAQDFSLRLPLVDGQGNFGSLDGDSPAAYRYTECRLAAAAMELLSELKQDTVDFRANFDGTADEPAVLPARYPNLLVNGATGIAVGMATNIPPHNLREVTRAAIALIGDRDMTTTNILKHIQGPDFPTGGQLLNSKVELRQIYEEGSGAIKVRATYKVEKRAGGGVDLVIDSLPWPINKATLVEQIADVIIKRKLPQLVDIRDESTGDVRIVCECKRGADADVPGRIMAYLFKHTSLQQNFNVNLTCLLPSRGAEAGVPERVGIKAMLEHFLDFRFETVKRRFEFELDKLRKRIHILEGFVILFDALDEAIRIIRRSDGKKDAAQKLIKRFGLDEIQVDAILELRLYKLARLEILEIRAELDEKKAEAARIEGILGSDKRLWGVVSDELSEVAEAHGTPRKTKTAATAVELEFDADAYIVDEDAIVVVTADGWIKRQRELKDPASTRTREGDSVRWALAGSTKEVVVFFTNLGYAYVTKINDVTPTSGYGDPAQKLFKFKDRERIVYAMSLDPRMEPAEEMLAVSASGYGLRFGIEPHTEVSTRAGRRYARPSKGDEIIGVAPTSDEDVVAVCTHKGHRLRCWAEEINRLEGPGKGVRVIKAAADDRVIGFISSDDPREALVVKSTKAKSPKRIYADPDEVVSRGGKGIALARNTTFDLVMPDVVVPELEGEEE